MTPQHSRRRPKERSGAPQQSVCAGPAGGRAAAAHPPHAPQPGAFLSLLTPEISVMRQLVLLQQREKGYRWEFEA